MSIRNREAYACAAWDWDICLKGCFKAGSPSDLDGVYERKGRILIIEAKGPGASLPTGQRILLEAFARKPGITVVVLRGPKNEPREYKLFDHDHDRLSVWMSTTPEGIRQFCRLWYQIANGQVASGRN